MAANINGSLRVAGQVLNLKPENLAADPTGGGLVESRLWYNTVSKAFKFYNGTGVVDLAAGGISQEDLETALLPYAETTEVNSAISTAIADLVSGTEMQSAIDNALAGLDFQADVLGLETDYVATPGRYIYVDGSLFTSGVAAAAGDIVTVDAAGVILSVAYDVSAAGPGALTWNVDGIQWLRWDGTTWAEFGGLTGFTAGNGIEKTGDVVSVKAANASIVVAAGGISVGDLSATYVTPAAQTTAISTALADYATDTELTAVADDVTALETKVTGSFFAFDSGATSATTHTITHNLNFRWPIVQLVDPTTNQIITADSVEFTSVNELVVTLATAATLRASVSWVKTA
jgi:hypothetical protein